MIGFVVCLVFNAHPDFWLPDEEFFAANSRIVRQEEHLVGSMRALEYFYRYLSENQSDPEEVDKISKLIDQHHKLYELDRDRLLEARAVWRMMALTGPRRYHNR